MVKREEKKSSIFKGKILKKPTAKIPSVNPYNLLVGGLPDKVSLVTEGRTGYFKEEYVQTRRNWLS